MAKPGTFDFREGGKTRKRILFRCDGDVAVGLGHVVRCLALAEELTQTYGCQSLFAMRTGPAGFQLVAAAGYPVRCTNADSEVQWLEAIIREWCPEVLVLDVRSDLPRYAVEKWRRSGLLVVVIEDPSERRLAADLAFYPPVPQVRGLDWASYTGQLYVGWEWVILRHQFSVEVPSRPLKQPMVLITMGGSDPARLTLKALEAINLLDNEEFEAAVVLGAGFSHAAALESLVTRVRRPLTIWRNVSNMAALMAEAYLAVASFGVTAYELAAMGVPAIYLCLTEDHSRSAEAFAEAGIAITLGVHTRVSAVDIASAVKELLQNRRRILEMSEHARRLVDGQGARRVAGKIITFCQEPP